MVPALPPTINLCVPDHARRGCEIGAVMSNSFAFGGANAVLVARAA